tara:strand:+ start:401 stop:949 length:549 start_codon:yes stop_codon:yes gene_type:complete
MKINGRYIYLRKINILDSSFIFKLRKNKNNSYYLHKPPKSINEQKKWIMNNNFNKKNLDFVIFDKIKNKRIGTIGFNNINRNNAEWGRWISNGKSHQNIEAVILLINYGFKKLKLKNIYSLTNRNNKKVSNFHSNTPAIYGGIIKSYFLINNKKADAIKYIFNKRNFLIFKKKFISMTELIQ